MDAITQYGRGVAPSRQPNRLDYTFSYMRLPPVTRLLTHNLQGVHGKPGDRRIAMNGDEFTHCQETLIVRTRKVVNNQNNLLIRFLISLIHRPKGRFFLWKIYTICKSWSKVLKIWRNIGIDYLKIYNFLLYIIRRHFIKIFIERNYHMYSMS